MCRNIVDNTSHPLPPVPWGPLQTPSYPGELEETASPGSPYGRVGHVEGGETVDDGDVQGEVEGMPRRETRNI